MQAILKSETTRRIAIAMAVVMGIFSIVPKVDAAFVSSAQALNALNSDQDLEKVRKVLENKKVRSKLYALGYDSEEISLRLDRLSDEEVHSLATRIEHLNAAGNGLGTVIGILVVVLLVLLILKLLDKRIIIS